MLPPMPTQSFLLAGSRGIDVGTHDDLKEALARAFGQLLHAHVTDDEQVRVQRSVLAAYGVVVQEVRSNPASKEG